MARYPPGTGDVFDTGCDLIDVTSLSRPDTSWRIVDAHGHEHRWYVDGGGPNGDHISATSNYSPQLRYITPTLVWVQDGIEYFEDGESLPYGHHECARCAERVTPSYCPDSTTQHIPGLRWCRINGEPVSPDEFKRRLAEAYKI